ncbi:MAG: tetratricopeptide repeat protein, partial [Flavobacteriales bacterium]|nr:tetratricopeptide repeat protein [Flavobacteriales bacterium]
AMMLNRIGTIYTSQDNIEKGFEYYQQSLSIYQKLNEHQQISNPLNNLGSYYKDKEDYPTALNYYEQSLLIDIKNKNQQGIATVQSNIGGIYVVQEKYSQALIVFIKGLKISEELGDKNLIALLLNNIGQIYYLQGDYKSAYFNVSSALKIAKEANYLGRINASSFLLSQIYNDQKDPENALKMYKIYTYTKDSMTNKSIKIDAIKQQSKYEYEKQKAVDDAINDKQKQKQEIITYAIGFGLTLVLIFLIFVFNRLQVTRKQKIIIEGAHKELSEKNKEILDSITYAKRIQNAILPTDNLVKELLKDSFVLYKPKDIVAGDFYWVKTLPTGEIIFSVADCTGHGVPGAMVSMVCNNALNRSIKEYGLTNLGEILDKTREIVIEEFSLEGDVENKEDYVKDGMDIALCSLQGDTLQYAGANNPLWIVREGEVIITKANKQPIGSFRSSEPFIVHTIELQKEDVIYIFSDGYADQFGGEKGKKFMAKAFRKLLISIQEKTMSEQQKILNDSFESWRGSLEQVDDVCIIGVRI